jgi:(2Fe-2S) ferredoxin
MSIWQKFADVLNQRQMYDKVMVSGVRSCLAPCQFGPVVLVYPEGVWYGNVQEADVEEIFDKHFIDGQPIERLLIPEEVFGM